MPRPNIWGLLIVLFAILLLFGWKRLPDLARSVGQSMRIFKSEVEEMTDKGGQDSKPSAASHDTVRGQTDEARRDHRDERRDLEDDRGAEGGLDRSRDRSNDRPAQDWDGPGPEGPRPASDEQRRY